MSMNSADTLIEVRDLSKHFGGVQAVNNVSFNIDKGEVVGLIGPNGAGKTTLFNIIAGRITPDSGDIIFQRQSIIGKKPHQINHMGIARTFQKLRPFAKMKVLDNVIVAALTRINNLEEAKRVAENNLELVGLIHRKDILARGCSTGERKRLEMARAMATQPVFLMLDELTGGVDQRSIPGLIDLIMELKDKGITMLVIEHNMSVIISIADRIVALNLGSKIADGHPTEVAKNPRVISAYLGGNYA